MDTKGVSRQVSVEIGDVDHWAEKAATRGREENLRQVGNRHATPAWTPAAGT